MSVIDDSLSAALDFLLASDGTVIGIGPTRGDVDVSEQLGRPFGETFWFRHNDNDERDLWNLLRTASRGKADRLRVWIRVSEHQLVRCDLMVTPIIGSNGEIAQLSARTEPTPSTPRRRAILEPIVKDISSSGSSSSDLLRLQLSVPMMRVDRSSLLVIDANNAFLDFFNLKRESLPSPLINFIESSAQESVLETIAQMRIEPAIEVRVMRNNLPIEVGFCISLTPQDHDGNSVMIAISDRSTERLANELRERAEQLSQQAAQQNSTLRTLERLIEACPTPIGLIENGKLSHASKSLRLRFDAEALSALVTNRRTDSDSDVFPLDEARNVFGVIGTTSPRIDSIDSSALLGFASIDLHGRIHHWNAAFARWAGADDSTSLRGLFEALDTESRLALEVSLRKFEGESQVLTLRFERTPFVCRCEIFQAGSAFLLLAIDQTDGQRRLDEIELALAGERHLLDALPMRLIRVDGEGKLIWSNRAGAACDLTNLEAILDEYDSHDTSNNGLPLDSALELHPIEQSSSGTTYALVDRREERALRRRSDQLNALEALVNNDPPLALLELDLQTGITTANAVARELLKLGTDDPIVLSELCAPVDRIAVERAFYGGSHSDTDRIDFEFRLDSTGQKLRAVGQMFFDQESGTPVPSGAVARLIDVEKEKIASIERNPITTALFESIQGAVRIYMPQTVRQNGAAIRLFGIDGIDWRDIHAWRTHFNPRDAGGNEIAADALPIQLALRGESTSLEMTIDTPQGARRVRSTAMPIRVEQEIVGCVCIDLDLTDEMELRQRIDLLESKLKDECASSHASTLEIAQLAGKLDDARSSWIGRFPVPVMRLDLQGRLIDANASAWKLLAIEPSDNPFEQFEWFDAQDRPVSSGELLTLFQRDDLSLISLHARQSDRSLWIECNKWMDTQAITLLLRDRSREISMMASLSQLHTRINEISSEAEAHRLRMMADHHGMMTLVQIMCADVDSVAQPLALDRRLPGDAHALARGAADVVSLAHRILDAAANRPRSLELSLGARRASDLVQLVREAIRLIGPLATRLARDVSFDPEIPEAIVDVEPALTRHAIVAALLGAIGNTPSRSRIEVRLKRSDGEVRIEVNGGTSTSMKKPGLMHQFADALARSTGASLEATTEPGACWSVRFALAAETTALRPIATRARCVLLVEDHESTSRVISRQLARVGCVVRTVRGAGEARLAMRESGDIDLILCDMSLPDGDPIELMTDLAREFGVRGIALGAGGESDLQLIRDAGFVERLAKPVDLVLLANVIDHVVTMSDGELESSR